MADHAGDAGVFSGKALWGKGPKQASKQTLYTDASNLLKQKKYSEALALFEQLAADFPGSTRARRGCAVSRIALNDFTGAKADIEAWIANLKARGESDADAHFHLGECLQALGDEDGAAACFKTAIGVNPIHTRALKALGRA
jgi:TolA-binding protein